VSDYWLLAIGAGWEGHLGGALWGESVFSAALSNSSTRRFFPFESISALNVQFGGRFSIWLKKPLLGTRSARTNTRAMSLP